MIMYETASGYNPQGIPLKNCPYQFEKFRIFRMYVGDMNPSNTPDSFDFYKGIYMLWDTDIPGMSGEGCTRIFVDGVEMRPDTSGGMAGLTINNMPVPIDPMKVGHVEFIGDGAVIVQPGTTGDITIEVVPGQNVRLDNGKVNAINTTYIQGTGVKFTQVSSDYFNPSFRIDSDLAGITDIRPIKVTSNGSDAEIELLYNNPLYKGTGDALDIYDATRTQRGVIKYDDVTLKRNANDELTAVKAIPVPDGAVLGTVIPDGDTITEDGLGVITATQMKPGKALALKPGDKYTIDVQYDDTSIKEQPDKKLYLNKDDETIVYKDDKIRVSYDGYTKGLTDDVTILYGKGNDGDNDEDSLYVRQAIQREVDEEGTETYSGIRGVVIPDGDTITIDPVTGVISGTKVKDGNALRYRTESKERHILDVKTDTDLHQEDPTYEQTLVIRDKYVYGDTENKSYVAVNYDRETLIYDAATTEALAVNIDGKKDKADLHRTISYDEDNLVHLNADSIVRPDKELNPALDPVTKEPTNEQYNPSILYDDVNDYVYIPKAKDAEYNEIIRKETLRQFGEAGLVYPDGKTLSVDDNGMIFQDNITVYQEDKKTFEFGDKWHVPSAEAVIQYVNQLDTFTIEQCTAPENTPIGFTWQRWDPTTSSIETVVGTLQAEDVENKKTTYLVPEYVVDDPTSTDPETYIQVLPTYVKTQTGQEYWDWASVGSTEVKLDKYIENINTVAGVPFYSDTFDTDSKDKNIQAYELGTELFAFQETQSGTVVDGTVTLNGPSFGGISLYDEGKTNNSGEKVITVKSDLYNYVRQQGNVVVPDAGVVIGDVNTNTASGLYSIASGTSSTSSANYSYTFGNDNKALDTGAFVTGTHNTAGHPNQLVGGTHNVENADLLFMIGNGTSDSQKSNAGVIDYVGNTVYSGNVYVQAKDWTDKDNMYKAKMLLPVDDDEDADGNHTTKIIEKIDEDGFGVVEINALLPYVENGRMAFKFRV